MRLVWATVTSVESDDPRVQVLAAGLDDGSEGSAIAYPALTGSCAVDDRVLLNTTAVDLSLGTGGHHFVGARAGGGEVGGCRDC
jgi:hypothetical protein